MQTTATQYQVYIVRGTDAPSLEGCWGSENALFDHFDEAEDAAEDLAMIYGDDETRFIVQEV